MKIEIKKAGYGQHGYSIEINGEVIDEGAYIAEVIKRLKDIIEVWF